MAIKRIYRKRLIFLCVAAVTVYMLAMGTIAGICAFAFGRMGTPFDNDGFHKPVDLDYLSVLDNSADECQTNPIKILFCIKSAVGNFKTRQVLRTTWLSAVKKSQEYKFVFVLGRPESTNEHVSKFLSYEMHTFRDIVQGNFLDTYQNITLKSVFLLSWADRFCNKAKYVMSVDDDTFVNVKNLNQFIKDRAQTKNLLVGYVYGNAKPFRSKLSKWYASYKSYPYRKFPKFVQGAGYIMSSDVVSALNLCTISQPLFHLDDVFVTGICAQKMGIEPFYHPGFTVISLSPHACFLKNVITGPDMTSDDIFNAWNELEHEQFFNSPICVLSLSWTEMFIYGILMLIFIYVLIFIIRRIQRRVCINKRKRWI